MVVSDSALRAVAANAARHLIEGEQHLRAGRYPSAVASAILSAEETGKIAVLLSGDAPKKHKHAIHGFFVMSMLSWLEGHNARAAWAKLIDKSTPVQSLSPEDLEVIRREPEHAELIRRVESGEFKDAEQQRAAWAKAAAAKITREYSDALAGRANVSESRTELFTKGLQRLRLKATYVDVNSSGDLSDPNSLTEDVAKGLCLVAGFTFASIAAIIGRHRPGLSFADLMTGISTELVAVETLDLSTASRLCTAVTSAALKAAEN